MNLSAIFKHNPGKQLSLIGHRNRQEIIRARVDQMRHELGMPPVHWPRLR